MNFSEGHQGGCGRTPRTPPKSATVRLAAMTGLRHAVTALLDL